MRANIVMYPKNYVICKDILPKLSKLTNNSNLNVLYKNAFENSEPYKITFKKSNDEFLKVDFEIDKFCLSSLAQWISTKKEKDYKEYLSTLNISYLTEQELNEAMIELQFELNKKSNK